MSKPAYRQGRPAWLNKKISLPACRKIKSLLKQLNLNTICEQSLCPNISQCFGAGVATFMILGDVCTRSCSFCAVTKGVPAKVDLNEPFRVAEAVGALNLNYAVITSPTRDDLPDGGAELFHRTVGEIKRKSPSVKVEVLIPDFSGNRKSIKTVSLCGAEVIAHNLETVPSLYIEVRKGADYQRSLDILRQVKQFNRRVYTKSGLMLGLGEKNIKDVLNDLIKAECDFLTLGQYLSPSVKHYPVKEFISPQKFSSLRRYAYKIGFKSVRSSPYTRSSYLAHTLIPD